MAVCTRYLGADLDTGAIHPSQWKMTKRQQTGNIPIAAGTQCSDFGLRAETNLYLKRVRQMGKSLITTSTKRTDFGLMDVLQWTTMLRVVVGQNVNICP